MKFIEAWDIPGAWYQAITSVVEMGREPGRGDAGVAKELPCTVHLKKPGTRPLVPESGPVKADDVTNEFLEGFFGEGEGASYYRERMEDNDQLSKALEGLSGPGGRDVVIGRPTDIDGPDSPRLALFGLRGNGGSVDLYAYFSSVEAYEELPVDLGGLQMLKKWAADGTGSGDGRLTITCPELYVKEENFAPAESMLKEEYETVLPDFPEGGAE